MTRQAVVTVSAGSVVALVVTATLVAVAQLVAFVAFAVTAQIPRSSDSMTGPPTLPASAPARQHGSE